MKIKKKTEAVFEIIFDESEVQSLEDIEDIFEVIPEDVISRSVGEALRLGTNGVNNLLDVVTQKRKEDNANSDS